jgi:dolichyl-phosphate-mannose-protein mannosyltransferase
MASTPASVRQRTGQNVKKTPSTSVYPRDTELNGFLDSRTPTRGFGSEWDYKLGLAVITLLAFVTRFWGIGHPNEVVFDEVHFGKVRFIGLFLVRLQIVP